MTALPEDRPPLLTEDDRESAVRRLREAYAEGHVAHEQLDACLQRVLTARTHGELKSALAPLPAQEPAPVSTIAAAGGRIRRHGAWRVPRRLKVESAFGNVDLDLSRAVIDHAVVDIELRLGTGRARITVPRDAVVDFEGLRTGWKDVLHRPRRASRTGGPTVRITGALEFGLLKIRHARR
ncbi:DUF1707 SHOCT-like domain-containing protein [Streptomyces pratensis]|uniref:DUF1707 SHOCT-like domain-containing protein n=1 Tax=Streptomyces pratensis TaxID=1169025 RepID=UPI003015B64F